MRAYACLLLALAGASFLGCSGSAEGGSLGSVALLLAHEDSGADRGSVFATFTEVALVPQGGGDPVVVFESEAGKEVNLAAQDFLLSVTEGIPPGTYGSVRVGITGVRFEGGECDGVEVDLPQGTVVLSPSQPIVVSAGDTVFLRIEIDVGKSLENGDGACTFRPVVTVEVGRRPRGDCPRSVTGTVAEVLAEGAGAVLTFGDDRHRVTFLVGEDTSFFDDDGLASDAGEIALGAELTVKGRLGGEGRILALVVVAGELLEVGGKVDTGFADGTFTLLPDEGEGIVGMLDVSVVDGTLVLLDCNEGSTDDIVAGARLLAAGKYDTGAGVLRAMCVEIDPPVLEGELTAIEEVEDGFEITLQVRGEEDPRTVFVPEDVGVHLGGDGEIPFELLRDLLDCGGLPVVVSLDPEDSAMAIEVRVRGGDVGGIVRDINRTTRVLTVGETVVGLLRDATIVDLRGGDRLASLADVESGDRVRVFGLRACETQDVDFHGFVLLVLPRFDDGHHDDRDDDDRDDHDDDDRGLGLGHEQGNGKGHDKEDGNHHDRWHDDD